MKTSLKPRTNTRHRPLPDGWGITVLLAFLLWAGPASAQGANPRLLTTFTNSTPAAFELFGGSVAAMGTDKVLLSAAAAAGGGEVYLFNLNGTLLTTFTNPGTAGNGFGGLGGEKGLAAMGTDRVLIGAFDSVAGVPLEQVGAAFLFSTSGALLTTFTNPNPAKVLAFGLSLAAVGNDRVVISGLANINNPPPYPGGVHLFTTNGTLLTTFTNPTPAIPGEFGFTLAVVEDNRLLIGAPGVGPTGAGVAYLFSTNGALLTTITNPVPADDDGFGTAVAVVGSDRLLISAIDYGATKGTGGSAYLFTTNGTLLATFPNPTPAANDYFGWSVAAVGSSRVLIGASQDGAGALRSGAAYVFSTNGTLLATITNPTPAVNDYFGWAVAAVGTDHVLIGGVWDDTGAMDSGAAYLFALSDPALSIARSNALITISWPTFPGFVLQQNPGLNPANWTTPPEPITDNGATKSISVSPAPGNRFFRLLKP